MAGPVEASGDATVVEDWPISLVTISLMRDTTVRGRVSGGQWQFEKKKEFLYKLSLAYVYGRTASSSRLEDLGVILLRASFQ